MTEYSPTVSSYHFHIYYVLKV